MITRNSKIKEAFNTPVGHDVISKILLQANIKDKYVKGGIIGNLKLKTLAKLSGGKVSEGFLNTFINLLNRDDSNEAPKDGEISHKWWKEAVFYQIYPRSFNDANGDGIGDLKGIIEKLDYIKNLGVDAIWLSPIYDSPNDDNGYDIRDYRKIMTEFGTMEDFDELLKGIHDRGMRLIMDLVVNHTSDEHPWFQEALKNPDSPYRKYYFFREGDGTTPPNNWKSFFSGSAWNYYDEQKVWALHLFSKKQMDLNWECEEMRKDVIDMIRFWLSKGVDGFRMDVINYISKDEGLPEGDKAIGELMGFTGVEHYFYGPKLHDYLKEIRKDAFDPFEAFSVGETPGIGLNMARKVTGEERRELDMIFSFDHLETPGHTKFEDYKYDLDYLKKYLDNWTVNYGNNCWQAFFYNNHDNPRMISKIDTDPRRRFYLGSMLAVLQFTVKGTPFVFQGDEMGLTNYPFKSMDQITDVEAKNYYKELLDMGKTPEEAFKIIVSGTREHTRMMLPWKPGVQVIDPTMTEAYKELIRIRKENPLLVYGDYELLMGDKGRYTYARFDKDTSYVIDCNLTTGEIPALDVPDGRLMYSNYEEPYAEVLKAYEGRIWVV